MAHMQACGMDNLPQNDTGDASSGAGSSAILGRKDVFWSHCFQTIPVANSTEIKYVSQISFNHPKWKKGPTSQLSTKLTWQGGECGPLKHSYFQPHSCFWKISFLTRENKTWREILRKLFFTDTSLSYIFLRKRPSTCTSASGRRKPKDLLLSYYP